MYGLIGISSSNRTSPPIYMGDGKIPKTVPDCICLIFIFFVCYK